jgi:hypothetical protein
LTFVPEHPEWHALPSAAGRGILAQLVDAEVANQASFNARRAVARLPSNAIWRLVHA